MIIIDILLKYGRHSEKFKRRSNIYQNIVFKYIIIENYNEI